MLLQFAARRVGASARRKRSTLLAKSIARGEDRRAAGRVPPRAPGSCARQAAGADADGLADGVRGADEVAGRGRFATRRPPWRSRSATRTRSQRSARCSRDAKADPAARLAAHHRTRRCPRQGGRAAASGGDCRQEPSQSRRSAGWPRSTTRRPRRDPRGVRHLHAGREARRPRHTRGPSSASRRS